MNRLEAAAIDFTKSHPKVSLNHPQHVYMSGFRQAIKRLHIAARTEGINQSFMRAAETLFEWAEEDSEICGRQLETLD